MCQDHCEAGAHHHHASIQDWRHAWETSKVEPITLEPVDGLTITRLIDNVVDPLAVNEGRPPLPASVPDRPDGQSSLRPGGATHPVSSTIPLLHQTGPLYCLFERLC